MEVVRWEKHSVNTAHTSGKMSAFFVLQNQNIYHLPGLQGGSFPAGMKQDVSAEDAGSLWCMMKKSG